MGVDTLAKSTQRNPPRKSKIVRITISLPEETLRELDRIMAAMHAKSRSEVVKYAIAFFAFVMKKYEEGWKVGFLKSEQAEEGDRLIPFFPGISSKS